MGANQSSRKITVVNDEATGVIKISDAVVNRLKGEITGGSSPEKENQASTASPPAPTPPPPPPASEPTTSEQPSAAPPPPPAAPSADVSPPRPPPPSPPAAEAPVTTPPPPPTPAPTEKAPEQAAPHPNVWQRPIIQYIEEPSLSALKVRQEKEEEMKALEDYWKDRLQKQQAEHVSINKLTEEEVGKGVKSVEKLFTPAGNQQICRDERESVQSCYQTNSSQSLRCRDSVTGFMKCVTSARLNSG